MVIAIPPVVVTDGRVDTTAVVDHRSCAKDQECQPANSEHEPLQQNSDSILYGHSVGVDGFFSGDAFDASQHPSVILLVGLERQTSLLSSIVPSQSNEMLFGFGERYKRTNTERENSDADSCTNASVNCAGSA